MGTPETQNPKADPIRDPKTVTKITREVLVGIDVYPRTTLFFREGVAEGSYADVPVEVSLSMQGGAMLVRFEDDGVWYLFSPQSLIEAAWRIREAARAAIAKATEG